MDRPVLICGLGRVGWRILEHLRAAGQTITVIDLKADAGDPRLAGVTFVPGDCRKPEVLERAGARDCGGALVVTSEDLVNVTTALVLRRLNADARIVVRMFNQNLLARLGSAMSNTVALSVSALTAPLLALTAVTGDVVTAIKLEGGPKQIANISIEAGSPLIGKSVASLENVQFISLHANGSEPCLWHSLDREAVLAAGDTLMVAGPPAAIEPLAALGRDDAIGTVRWASWLRRQLRTLRRTLLAVDLSVKIAGAVLAFALIVTTLVHRFGVGAEWIDSFYQSVGLLATGADLRKDETANWIKVFFGVMKITGTALIAAFTAIFTQYLIRARLGGAFEARRIPDGGHVVVAGLGNVGFRCVEELVHLKQSVVAIDAHTESPFAATVRRMGVPVVVGNATIPAVLEQACVATAGAVIAATDSELSNLEIALLAREANLKQRVVVRLNEFEFAQAVRAATNIRNAVSLPSLVAPAFAAALFGDRVQSLLTVGTRTLAVLEIVVQEDEPHLQRMIGEVLSEYRLLPLSLNQKEYIEQNANLQVGDRLTVVVELKAMEKMIRRQS